MRSRNLSFAIVFLGLLVGSVPAGGAEAFSIEQVLSAPFPTSLVAAPKGSKVAWVFNDRGARNIWVAASPDGKARAVTSFKADDGQEISDLAWTPDGEAIVFVHGGDPNRQGEVPNPRSEPSGAIQEVWVVSARGGPPLKLGEGSSPAVPPSGEGVAYLKKGQIWWAALPSSDDIGSGGAAARTEQLIRARGRAGNLRWSPEGSRLAFVSRRGDHSFIGVYDKEKGSLRFLDPTVDQDSSPVWSPDGRRVAFLRVPASRALHIFGPHRKGAPWSIRVADAATGEGREVWRAMEGRGSVLRGIMSADRLFWAAGDLLVFPWEHDGWTHLYSVPVAGGEARLLTPGEHEVEYVSLSTDRRYLLYNSNQDDIDRRHLWRVAAAGGSPLPLTHGKGIEWSPVETSDQSALAFLRSDAHQPAQPAILVGSSEPRALAPGAIPPGFPSGALVEPEQVVFSSADGLRIHAQLFLPQGTTPGRKHPAVLFFHGGSRRQMLLGWHYMGYYHNAYAFNQVLASRGYVVLSVNYRSGIGYGMEFREALNYGATGASEFNDVLGAGLYLRSRPEVDPERIALWGGSYGGYLTALGLARASDLFAAGVDLHGVHDWNQVIRNFVPSYNPLKMQEKARLAFASSPMASIDTWRSPVLLIHGDDDRNVPFSESVDLAERLRERGVEVEQLIFPDEVHGFLRHAHWIAAYEAAADFLDRHLQPGATPTSDR